ncbi:MAG: C25 family cysteine peptidase, partial [Pirellulaceae bacterium]|nr:C25 family cysteine peptidase [Pirellulaceae bacterium]
MPPLIPLILATLITADPAWDTVVVCPPELRETLQPWIQLRTAQGRSIGWISNGGDAAQIQESIRRSNKSGKLRWVMLVGDVANSANADNSLTTPTHLVDAKVNVKWGSEPEIATDNNYGDLDGDGLPEVAVGRLPVDNASELALMVRKIIHYESRADYGTWRRKLHVVAGVGGFGKFTDMVLESTTKKFLIESIPPAYETTVTYASWRSPYCPDPRDFHQTTVERFNEGGLFWVYIGHGQKSFLDLVRTPNRRYPILDVRHMNRLQSAGRPPIAVFLACYTGAYDAPRDCLGEEMVTSEGGPVAVLAGSRVTMPYAMAVLSSELMRGHFQERLPTLGEVLVYAKRRLAAQVREDDPEQTANRVLLDKLAAVISPAPQLLGEERREHVSLFNLLGDPLLRLQHPHEVEWDAPERAVAGEEIRVSGSVSAPGDIVLEFANREMREIELLGEIAQDRAVGVGLVDVKSFYVETPEDVAEHVRE